MTIFFYFFFTNRKKMDRCTYKELKCKLSMLNFTLYLSGRNCEKTKKTMLIKVHTSFTNVERQILGTYTIF